MNERPKSQLVPATIGCALWAGLVVLVLAPFAMMGYYGPSRLPSDVRTIAEFEKRMPAPEKVWLRVLDGREVFVVQGREDPISLNFGPPVYFFDGGGQFISWSHDIGDDASEFELHAYHSSDLGKELTISEAVEVAAKASRGIR